MSTDTLDRALAEADGLVFLCSGNMVRSAFAELYARHLGCPLPLSSGATTYRNDSIYPNTAVALAERGVSQELIRAFRPTHLDDLLPALTGNPLVFGMTRAHLADLEAHPRSAGRPFLLAAAVGREAEEIADPVLEGADFGRTFTRVAQCVEALLEAVERVR